MSLEYIFGAGTCKYFDSNLLSYRISPRTGRLRYVLAKEKDEILFSFRANGSIAPTVKGARLMLQWTLGRKYIGDPLTAKPKNRPRWIVTVSDGVTEVISSGKTVFCKHVVMADDSLRANEDVGVMNEAGYLLAVGRSILSGPTMKQFKRGAAVKTREGRSVSQENVTSNEL